MLSVTPHFDKLLDGVLESRPISQHTWLFAKFPLTPALEKREREREGEKKTLPAIFPSSHRRNHNHIWQVLMYARTVFYKINTMEPLNPEAAVL